MPTFYSEHQSKRLLCNLGMDRKKQFVRGWAGFNWLMIGLSDELL